MYLSKCGCRCTILDKNDETQNLVKKVTQRRWSCSKNIYREEDIQPIPQAEAEAKMEVPPRPENGLGKIGRGENCTWSTECDQELSGVRGVLDRQFRVKL